MISYEFEGHDLTEWAAFGGLPIWYDEIRWRGHLIAYGAQGWLVVDRFGEYQVSHVEPKLRYSTLEDVIGERPKWANSFIVHDDGTAYWRRLNSISSRLGDIKGYLFDPSVYTEPVKLEEIKK